LLFPITNKDTLTIAALLVNKVFKSFGFRRNYNLIKEAGLTIFFLEEF